MIAKQEWFTRRKYTGWGLSPKTWQGWVYVGMIAVVAVFIQSLPLAEDWKMGLTMGLIALIAIDVLHVMTSIKLDEREQKIESTAERNASWAMVTASVITILYVATIGGDSKGVELMPALIFPLMAGVVAKGLSNFILSRREI
jgi:hypothetical protein